MFAAGVAKQRAHCQTSATPLEMGPAQLVAGSHTGLRQWTDAEADASNELVASLALDGVHTGGSVIPAGSLLIFNTRACHRTTPAGNRTSTPRDIVTNAYALPCVEKAAARAWRHGRE